SVGTCTNIPGGMPDAPLCTAPAQCDGAGLCKSAIGQPCGTSSNCLNGLCVDGYCCNSPCTLTCQACNVPGALGTCSNIPAGSDDTMCSGATLSCDGNGSCKQENGQACAAASDCLSGSCVDGYCCNSVCTGTCLACNVTGSLGTCTPVPLGQA